MIGAGQTGAAGATFDITYEDEDRAHALKVVSVLLDTLITETLGGKRQGSAHAQEFLESQLRDYEKRLQVSEDKLAAFKSQHMGVLPSDDGGYFAQMQKENQAVADAKTGLLMAQNRRATLEGQLHGNAAVLASSFVQASGGGSGSTPADTVSEIAAAQAHLDALLLKFTARHPDVIATRAALAVMQARRAAEIESLRNGDAAAAAATGASSNPVFQSIQLALNKTDVEIADLRTQLQQHESKAGNLRQLVDTAPQVEADYVRLTRDYDVNKAQYAALLSSYDKSKLGQRADDAGSVRFQVVQPPTVSFQPVSPRRSALLADVLVAALVVGAALGLCIGSIESSAGVGRCRGPADRAHGPRGGGSRVPDARKGDFETRVSPRGDCGCLPGGSVSGGDIFESRRIPTEYSGAAEHGAYMSVIESALEKLRRKGTSPDSIGARHLAASLESWSASGGPEVVSNRAITLDILRLSGAGYLPEAGQELRFADYYREVKRPIIQRAFAGNASGSQRLILITSSLPAEGKTFTALNLALSIARERDISVLLIDADFPKAHIGRALGVSEEPGLLDAVASSNYEIESLVVGTDVKGLSVLPGGRFTSGATELVASARMGEVLARLVARNPRRLILLDSPPLLVSSEARALNQLPGQILLVARSGVTPRRALQDTIAQIDPRKLQGLVLNNAHAKTHTYYYGRPEPVGREAAGHVR